MRCHVVSAATSVSSRPVAWKNWASVMSAKARGWPPSCPLFRRLRIHATNASAAYQPPRSRKANRCLPRVLAASFRAIQSSMLSSVVSGSRGRLSSRSSIRIWLAATDASSNEAGSPRKLANTGLPSGSFSASGPSISSGVYPAAIRVAVMAPADVPSRRPGEKRFAPASSCSAPTNTMPLAPPPSKMKSISRISALLRVHEDRTIIALFSSVTQEGKLPDYGVLRYKGGCTSYLRLTRGVSAWATTHRRLRSCWQRKAKRCPT